ncbi:MAG: hypothetical protein U5J78_06965 [Parasphingorhabdus sp.]|nr:hypothetical protein [Parasphingorhabdus sp.]
MNFRIALIIPMALGIGTTALAQDSSIAPRVDKLEREMRAVQRKVFDGPAGQFFEPDIKPDANAPNTPSNSTTPVTDLIARVDALEGQVARLTGQVEQQGFRLKKLEDQLAAQAMPVNPPQISATPSGQGNASSPTPSAAKSATSPPKQEASATRRAAVAAIVKPETGDAAEDSYSYGFRLWDAKFYPEAQEQLKQTVAKFSSHSRASYAQNLLGRAYLDDGKPALASVALYENYQKRPRGERAPDSLFYLGTALIRLDKKAEACKVYSELSEVYPAEANGRLNAGIARGKAAAGCK